MRRGTWARPSAAGGLHNNTANTICAEAVSTRRRAVLRTTLTRRDRVAWRTNKRAMLAQQSNATGAMQRVTMWLWVGTRTARAVATL